MKILFLGEPSSPNTISWVEGLKAKGCEVVIASARTDGSDGNIPIGSLHFPPRLRILMGVGHLKKIISDIKPDILIAYRITSYGYLAARTAFHPLILAAQNEQIVYLPKPSPIRKLILEYFVRYAVKNADLIHSWGKNITKGLLKFHSDEEKILTLHRGIDMGAFNFDKVNNIDRLKPVFISTRSLYPEYLVDELIDAFSLLVKQIPGAKLEIAGDGPELPLLKTKRERLGLKDNITFHGRLSKDKLLQIMRAANIYMSIIQTEGLSSSLIESISCSLLPIVADIPSSREMVQDKKNGFLVKKIDPETLSSVMSDAVNDFDNMRDSISENMKIVKQKYDRDINQQIFIEKYQHLLNSL